jgi:hypothetical protein
VVAVVIAAVAYRQAAAVGLALIAIATTAGIVWLKYETFPKLDDAASARTLWQRAVQVSPDVCAGDLRRAWIYGLNYYAGRVLASCEEKPAQIQILPSADGPRVLPGL